MIKAGIDWGSSAFRAYRFDPNGEVLDTVNAELGIKFVPKHHFQKVMIEQIGHWLEPDDRILLSGMITSRNGWIETPYVECPANLDSILGASIMRQVEDIELIFLPGLSQQHPADVMRGEELQLLGCKSVAANQTTVIPGTHSKWAVINNGTVRSFHTIATGEMFELLLKNSLIGKLSSNEDWTEPAFLQGVSRGFESRHLIHDLFACRSRVLLDQSPSKDVYSYLSGILIGNEIGEGIQLIPDIDTPLVLVGSDTLCNRYMSALRHLNIQAEIAKPDAAARGFAHLIRTLNN